MELSITSGIFVAQEAKKIKLVIKNKFARITMQITSGEGYLQFYEKLIFIAYK
jgi:hypothetical protein